MLGFHASFDLGLDFETVLLEVSDLGHQHGILLIEGQVFVVDLLEVGFHPLYVIQELHVLFLQLISLEFDLTVHFYLGPVVFREVVQLCFEWS